MPSGSHPHDGLGGGRVGPDVEAEDAGRAAVGPEQPGGHREGRRLAGAVGADEPVERPAGHGEREPVDHPPARNSLTRPTSSSAGPSPAWSVTHRPHARAADELAYFASTPRVYFGAGWVTPSARRRSSSASSTSRSSVPAATSRRMPVAVADEGDRALVDRLGGDVPDAEAGRAAGEPAVGEQEDVLAEPGALDGPGDREHLAHPRTALGALVADDDDVAGRRACRPRRRPSRPARRRRRGRCPRRRRSRSPADFTTAPSGASEPVRMVMPPVAVDRVAHRAEDLAVGVRRARCRRGSRPSSAR